MNGRGAVSTRNGVIRIGSMQIPIRQQPIADSLGLSLMHTYKKIRQLTATIAVRWKDRTFAILDQPVPETIAGDDAAHRRSRPFMEFRHAAFAGDNM
jgi:CRP/FNR family transcriptional regulator, anaerobic regulatory protein